jgi:hypothetical protein
MERPRIHECVFSLAGVPLTLALSAPGGYREDPPFTSSPSMGVGRGEGVERLHE